MRPGDFQRVLARPPLFRGTTIVAFAAVDGRTALGPPGARVGVAAARRISGAVARNRAKRRVREAVRVTLHAGLGTLTANSEGHTMRVRRIPKCGNKSHMVWQLR